MSYALIRAHAWKLGALGVAFVIGMAIALSPAEASGDPYGDAPSDESGLTGDPNDALGSPDTTVVEVGGTIVVSFTNNTAFDGGGTDPDIRVHVEPNGDAATATIAVSADGVSFVNAGVFDDTADVDIDLSALGLGFATAVRITYVSGEVDGYNLDAVETLNGIGEDAVLELTQAEDENPGFTSHTVSANVSDDGSPIEGVAVRFLVTSGPNAGDGGVVTTDASGDAAFTYDGDGGPGTDTIEAWLDVNGNEVLDAGELTDTALTKEWHGVTGDITLADVDAGGLVVGDLVLVTVDDRDLDTTPGPDSVDVQITSTTDGTGFVLTLTETGNSTGVFTGTFEVGDTTDAGSHVLAAVAGDDVTGTYDDELDGEGNDPEAVSDTLSVVEEEGDTEKVTVCHMPPGNPGNAHTISVGGEAHKAHLDHGDTLGECNEDLLPPTKQEQQLEQFCERHPDHQRCGALEDAAEDDSSAAPLTLDDEDDDGSSEEISGDDAAQQAKDAFCERKPDHQRCAGDASTDEEDGD